jgi:alpha-tubulin suppressor-like RCC1 family protein
LNGDGLLESNEITSISYVCNGVQGDAGANALVAQFVEPPGANCVNGGTQVQSGIDLNGDGQLESNEVTSISYVCNGAPAEAGAPDMLTSLVTEPPSVSCPYGATEIRVGVDTNGDGVLEPREIQSTTISCAPPPVSAMALGTYHTCALVGSAIECWGYNASGQLGDGTTTDSPTPRTAAVPAGAAGIAAGLSHTCALISDGSVQCWGDNHYYQLGLLPSGKLPVATPSSPTPVSVPLTGATAVAAGGNHSCALLSDGSVYCWGQNTYGQLGDGTKGTASGVSAVSGLPAAATAIVAGANHTCALLSDGSVYCWGQNTYGQLGDGTTADSPTPVSSGYFGGSGRVSITAGDSHTCALRLLRTADGGFLAEGEAYCWGNNASGQLGDGAATGSRSAPTVVAGYPSPPRFTAIVAGAAHTCGLDTNANVECWGDNADGQLGNGTNTNRNTPVVVPSLRNSGTTAIAAGGLATCALLPQDVLECWGNNKFGQLGNGTTTSSSKPVPVQ